ncbi:MULTISPECIES: porin [Cupriavidus]|uniref:Porin n=1 Tax=Cupriavidus pauculus TaxID=82633 RepID=A0A3G8GXN5_9BURK|nr:MULTISPECIES: porin [Cupriavidus]AZG12894.1 porin [Cupriavidus pauculus]MDT6962344.1 porin [Cupriavidus sp. SZY C1]
MKKSLLTLAIGSLCCGSAFAQTSVTLYGIADVSVRWTNHANAAGNSQVQMTDGAVTQSRWGLKGSEALGNNLKAIFQLEGGYSLDNGTMNSSGQIFNRQAYVGLAGDFGAIKLGRQYTEGFNLFGDFDPLTIGNYTANAWPFFLTQFRQNNVVSYSGSFAGLNVGASYGFGEQPGSQTKNQYWGTRAAYDIGPFGIGAVYQEIKDINSNKQQMWGVAGKYGIGPAKLFLGYVGGRDSTGVIDNSFLNQAAIVSTPAARTAIAAGAASNPRKDTLGYVGVTYNVTPALAVTGVFYADRVENKNGVSGNDGNRYTGVLLAEYSLSKRTQVYGTVDYNKLTKGVATELPGNGTQMGVAAGIRHIF